MDNYQIDIVESSVGISLFLNAGKSFDCLFKQRFSDFIVNEITPKKNLVQITNKSLWKNFIDVQHSHSQYIDKLIPKEKQINPFDDFIFNEQESIQLLGLQATQQIQKYLEELKVNSNRTNFQIKIPLPQEKNERIQIHNFIRNNLPFLESITKTQNNQKKQQKEQKAIDKQFPDQKQELEEYILIKVHIVNFKRYKTDRLYGKNNQSQTKEFINFTLMKRNIDTINVGILVSKFLGISSRHFQMAGIKDKRGITSQRASLQGITVGQLEEIQTRKNWNQNIVITDYEYQNTPVALGDLYGNRFLVTLRSTNTQNFSQDAELLKNIENLKQFGFINYFGLQRFGVGRKVKTYEIGRELVKQNWAEAFRLIIESVCTDDKYLKDQFEQYLIYFDHEHMLKILPQKFRIERMLIQGLQKYGQNNFLSAFMTLPRNAREIYIHSFQSYIWNQMVNYRIQKLGLNVILGDLVQLNEINDEDAEAQDLLADLNQEVEEELQDELQNNIKVKQDEQGQNLKKENDQIILVTKDNIDQISLKDIVIPLFGSNTQIPQTSIYNEIFDEALMKEGVTKIDFIRLNQQFLIGGRYRKLICIPESLEHRFISYATKDEDLITPFDEQLNIEQGKYNALILKFILKKSAYATMLIREVLKQSSSLEVQQKLAVEYNKL